MKISSDSTPTEAWSRDVNIHFVAGSYKKVIVAGESSSPCETTFVIKDGGGVSFSLTLEGIPRLDQWELLADSCERLENYTAMWGPAARQSMIVIQSNTISCVSCLGSTLTLPGLASDYIEMFRLGVEYASLIKRANPLAKWPAVTDIKQYQKVMEVAVKVEPSAGDNIGSDNAAVAPPGVLVGSCDCQAIKNKAISS